MGDMLIFFSYEHLPTPLKEVSKLFYDLAQQMIEILPDNEEARVGLRKLLEAKDCAVRAALLPAIMKEKEQPTDG